jgi:predicted alpha/beta-hydrolase family hydrolase
VARESTQSIPFEKDSVRGFLHMPSARSERGLVLTHGAGGNCASELLVAVAEAFSAAGVAVLRCDLPYRQQRPTGPPFPGKSATDRAGLAAAVRVLSGMVKGDIYLGGHSYGGRQASMLAADNPALAQRLLLLSYPLHPTGKPEQLRTEHFAKLETSSVFVHGTKDSFASIDELELALKLIAAPTKLVIIEGAGHDLKKGCFDLALLTALLT